MIETMIAPSAIRNVPVLWRAAVALLLALQACMVGVPRGAYAEEPEPALALRFPHPRISEREWATFQAEVMARPGAELVVRPEAPDLTIVAVPNEFAIYYFTRSGPAHPAVSWRG